jgi:hypothetical protein
MSPARVGIAALVVGLLIGFVPTYLQLRDADARAERYETRALLSDAHSRMSQLLLATQEERWGDAQSAATPAFQSVESALAVAADPETSRRLMTASQSRDEIIAGLATGDRQTVRSIRLIVDLLAKSLSD